ncbi:MAG: purine-nucleoside phosphorylase [Fretibacterium sp.]|nr:purine-nucleoside phosphorylase [Fretibacterium sp.]
MTREAREAGEKYYGQVVEALEYLSALAPNFRPELALILGSGLGSVADELEDALVVDAGNIPHWPVPTAPGHAGRVLLGRLRGRDVALLQGRAHFYEGYSMRRITLGVRVLGMWGAKQYVATNASGGVSFSLRPGDLVLVQDHINLMGDNPLIGPDEPRWNERFPDMTYAYSPRLTRLLERASVASGVPVQRGIYAAFSGPSYETPAEVRMARLLGADLVGMSTVPEVLVANAMGMETAVISCVANKGAGMTENMLTESEVLAAMERSSQGLARLLLAFMEILSE